MDCPPIELESRGEAQTERLGARLGACLGPGDLVALSGPLGAGKTRLVKGIAAGLGLEDPRAVTSPTFVLIRHHDCGRLRLHHVDAYRLGGEAGAPGEAGGMGDLISLGIDDLLAGEAVTVAEWPERAPELLERPHLAVTIRIVGASRRTLVLAPGAGFPAARFRAIAARLVPAGAPDGGPGTARTEPGA